MKVKEHSLYPASRMLSFLRPNSCIVVGFTLFFLGVQSRNSSLQCLGSDADIQAKLTSTSPPFDNYFNISRAIYPSTYISSLYVKIRVKFVSDRENETQLYTWAMSCLYVSTEYVSLHAMNLYSLGAIFPNRRQRELEITLPELCSNMRDHDNGSNSKMIYFLSTLEDIAIKPGTMEPQMNTVECVVKGHNAFTSNIFSASSVNHYVMMNICWCVWLVSLILAIVGALMFGGWIDLDPKDEKLKKERQYQKKSAKFLFKIVSITEIILALIACFNCSPLAIYPVFFIISMFCFTFIFLLYIRNRYKRWLIAVLAFCTFFMSFHHLIWIVFGVLTEPFWAVPILVVACSFCFSVYVHAYYNFKAFSEGCDIQAVCLSAAIIISLLLFFFVTGVVSQSFLSSDPVFGLIQSALVLVATCAHNSIKKNLQSKSQNKKSVKETVSLGTLGKEDGDADDDGKEQ